MTQVTVDYQHFLPFNGKAHGDIHGQERLAAARIERGHDDDIRCLILASHELQVGTQYTECLVDDVTAALLDNNGPDFLWFLSITDGTIFSKIITKEDMSQVSMFLAPSGITGSSVGIDPELNFKSIKNFKYSSNMTTDPVFQFERVYGNMEIIRGSKKGVSAPNLVSVDGYLSIETTMANNISFPKLEIVGGQLCIIGNLNAVSNYDYDFTNLKSVGCSSNPQYIKEGVINNILYGSLDFMASNKDFTFPSLEHVGGVGMTVRTVKTISCPKLQAIDGTLCAANAASLTTFNMPTLTKLSGVRFIRLTRFVDYTFFKSFVEEEQIKKEDWLVTNCGYNPTYEDMQAGRYTQQ